MGSEDLTRLRVQNRDTLKSDYVTAAKSLPGPAGVVFKSSQQIVENAKRVKDSGFNAIEFNLKSGLYPDWDKNNVVAAMKRTAQAAHDQGLKFLELHLPTAIQRNTDLK
jgi:phosphotransferase system IIB component